MSNAMTNVMGCAVYDTMNNLMTNAMNDAMTNWMGSAIYNTMSNVMVMK